ncbi:MAG TPA: class I SAM-dependent methyltransferase [Kofleriaceae bacterium]|nr:class I SAM-dependent methyltransferase [Kofleriaceae bacterium]
MAEHDWNPQAKEMADESMVRNLIAQAEAIWPQEAPIVASYGLGDSSQGAAAPEVLDVGCGIGEIAFRIAELWPTARITGIDLVASHLERARARTASFGDRVTFREADARELPLPDAQFDLVICRHVLQAVLRPDLALREMIRVAKPGARLHLLVEDYGMIHISGDPAIDEFWHHGPHVYSAATGCDLFVGRNCHQLLHSLGITDLAYHYVAVDTERVPRETFARIFEAWRDGYTEALAKHLRRPEPEIRRMFDATVECIRDPERFALWLVPIVTARMP